MIYFLLSEKIAMSTSTAKRARVAEQVFEFSLLPKVLKSMVIDFSSNADKANFCVVIGNTRFNHIFKVNHYLEVCGIESNQPFRDELIHFATRHHHEKLNIYCRFCNPRRLLGLSQFQIDAVRQICVGQGIESSFRHFKDISPAANPLDPSTCEGVHWSFIASPTFFENFATNLFPFRVNTSVEFALICNNFNTHTALNGHRWGMLEEIQELYENHHNWENVFDIFFEDYENYNGYWLYSGI